MLNKEKGGVLFITREYPWPSYTGALQYSAMLLKAIENITSQASIPLHVLCSEPAVSSANDHLSRKVKGEHILFHQYQIEPLAWKKILLTSFPQATLRKYSRDGCNQLYELLQKKWSLVIIDHIGATWSYELIRQYRGNIEHVLYCTHNEEYSTRVSIAANEPMKAPFHFLDACRARWTDQKIFHLANAVTCISSNDIASYHKYAYAKETSLHVVSPIYTDDPRKQRIIKETTPRCVCLVGSFIWSAKKRNLLMFLEACAMRFSHHDIQIKIIGNMHKDFQQVLKQRWPKVIVTGVVKKVEDHLNDVRIAVIPEQAGGGFKLKSLQYVFQRLPIFALDHALVDLPLYHQQGVQLYANMNELSEGVVKHIDNVVMLNQMQTYAFTACASFINPLTIEKTINHIVSGVNGSVAC